MNREMKLGKISGNQMKRSVWNQIHTKREGILDGAGGDCAIFAFPPQDVCEGWVSCAQESAVRLENPAADDIECTQEKELTEPVRTMRQLITKCVNNLVVSGAEPVAVLLTLLLPVDTQESVLKGLMAEADRACQDMQIHIAGGQTRVTGCINHLFAVVTGYGTLFQEGISLKQAQPGQDIVLSKWIGLEGTAMLAQRGRQKLLERYPGYLADRAAAFTQYLSIVPEAKIAVKSGVCAMHDASEGGILAALWELAEGAGVGLTIDLKRLPIRQETVEICERLNVNPYELLSGGCLIMTTTDGPELVDLLEAENIPAVIVGKLTDANDRLIENGEEVRYMDRPKQDEIYNIKREVGLV